MTRRKWDPQTKYAIVLQGLKGAHIVDICAEHKISAAHYYQWRDKVLNKFTGTVLQRKSPQDLVDSKK